MTLIKQKRPGFMRRVLRRMNAVAAFVGYVTIGILLVGLASLAKAEPMRTHLDVLETYADHNWDGWFDIGPLRNDVPAFLLLLGVEQDRFVNFGVRLTLDGINLVEFAGVVDCVRSQHLIVGYTIIAQPGAQAELIEYEQVWGPILPLSVASTVAGAICPGLAP